jgi:D-alanyl-D-alanine carboxypeptidase
VTRNFGLSRDFSPSDLVDLREHLPLDVTLGYETQVRDILLDPLLQMIMEMKAEGLNPTIISGYRSYPAQAIAWEKWQEQEPERASIISSPPGFSEHQLGTTLDFGSPELEIIVGKDDIQFHTYFYKTAVGLWLADNAHRYGFTLSYPLDTLDETGFYYEPWHYRYIGIELAAQLYEEETYLIKFLLEQTPEPCLP